MVTQLVKNFGPCGVFKEPRPCHGKPLAKLLHWKCLPLEGKRGGKPRYQVFLPKKPFLPLGVWVNLLPKLFKGGHPLQNKADEKERIIRRGKRRKPYYDQ
jgi:hypothetical protein